MINEPLLTFRRLPGMRDLVVHITRHLSNLIGMKRKLPNIKPDEMICQESLPSDIASLQTF
jgi:hypothetical protein